MIAAAPKCHCAPFKHPETEEDRIYLSERLRYFRSIGDMDGVNLVMIQLTTKCLSLEIKEVEEKE